MDSPELPIGERIAYYRSKNGNRTQAAIAGLCGISERYLSLIENGKRTPSAAVLTRLAAELGVPVSALLTEHAPPEPQAPLTVEPAVARALMGYGPARSTPPVAPAELRERVEGAWRTWQTSPTRYTDIAAALPALIEDVEHAVRAHRGGNEAATRREVLRSAADLYGLLRSYCRRTGRLDLSSSSPTGPSGLRKTPTTHSGSPPPPGTSGTSCCPTRATGQSTRRPTLPWRPSTD